MHFSNKIKALTVKFLTYLFEECADRQRNRAESGQIRCLFVGFTDRAFKPVTSWWLSDIRTIGDSPRHTFRCFLSH